MRRSRILMIWRWAITQYTQAPDTLAKGETEIEQIAKRLHAKGRLQ
jgi:hypothetical protein